MKKASVFLLLTVVVLALAATASANAAWVQHAPEDYTCTFGWFDAAYNLVLIEGEGTQLLTNSATGVSTGVCYGFIDFDDPNLLGMDEVCTILPGACFANGNRMEANYENTGGMVCTISGIPTTDWHQIVTRNGATVINCHIHPN